MPLDTPNLALHTPDTATLVRQVEGHAGKPVGEWVGLAGEAGERAGSQAGQKAANHRAGLIGAPGLFAEANSNLIPCLVQLFS